jgi:hypothetical protein
MTYDQHQLLIDRMAKIPGQIRWVDKERFEAENAPGVSPGEFLNRYGFDVIGTTIAGNAITKSRENEKIFFADHSWYSDRQICYQDLAGDQTWKTIPRSDENLISTLFELASNADDFESKLSSGKLDAILDEVD